MRKFLIPLLMAGVAMPTAVSARERGSLVDAFRERASQASSERSSDDRPQRAERPERAERVERAERPTRVERSERPVRVERAERPERIQRRQQVEPQQVEPQQVVQTEPVQRVERTERVRRSDRNLVDGFRVVAREEQAEQNGEIRRDVRDGRDRDRWRDRDGDRRHRWTSDWRRDHRYDWRNYRERNRSLFRIGRYYDPYGWNYRRFSIGFNLWPSYYSSSYWLNDPWQYRLPPAYGPYRWVRYYDDALLVNIYTGQVVDVLNNFFW